MCSRPTSPSWRASSATTRATPSRPRRRTSRHRTGCSSSSATTVRQGRCGAVRLLDPATAEIKRMWLHQSIRGRGAGAALLAALEAAAVELGANRGVLDTHATLTSAPCALSPGRLGGSLAVQRQPGGHPLVRQGPHRSRSAGGVVRLLRTASRRRSTPRRLARAARRDRHGHAHPGPDAGRRSPAGGTGRGRRSR